MVGYHPAVDYSHAMRESVRCTAKYRHYPALYDLVIATMPSAPTILEIGIANGGSLETWRTLFGAAARIIGVDLNPGARVLEEQGFEVLLLDTGLQRSWDVLRERLSGQVDLLVDDGGHTNRQQISAVLRGVELVRDGGWLVIEDLHASFMGEFGNPSPYSAARFLSDVGCDLHRRHPRSEIRPRRPNLASSVQYMVTAPSWVGLRIRRSDSGALEELHAGQDQSLMDYDHRWDSSVERHLAGRLPRPVVRALHNRLVGSIGSVAGRSLFRADSSPSNGSDSAG
jgi:hypothetical protein